MSHSLHPSTLIPPSTPSRLTSITVPSHHRYRPPKRSPARRVGSQAAVRLCLSHSPSSVTPANTPSSSRVASPVAAQGQTQGSFHPQSQISSHISANDLPSDAVLVQINDVPPQQSPRSRNSLHNSLWSPINHPACQRTDLKVTLCSLLDLGAIRLTERDLTIDGRHIDLWALHRAVFSWSGFESVRLIIIF